jgi:hypothetical protein
MYLSFAKFSLILAGIAGSRLELADALEVRALNLK